MLLFQFLFSFQVSASFVEEPIKKGMAFSGWSEIPETMPAMNITLEAEFTVIHPLLNPNF